MNTLSNVPYFDTTPKSDSQQRYTVEFHYDYIQIRTKRPPTTPLKTGSYRGNVHSFSSKSRKRMMMKLADEERVPDLFVTLTYSDDCVPRIWSQFRHHFEAFRRRLERKYPRISAVWKVEIENRKSGTYQTLPFPHFHLIVWLPDDMKNCTELILESQTMRRANMHDKASQEAQSHSWSQWWHDITGSTHEEHLKRRGCDISKIKSRTHGYHYVSKYASKQSVDEMPIGRRWGVIGTVGQGSRADIIINKQTYAELKRLIITYLKRLTNRKTKRLKNQSINDGLTVFGMSIHNTDRKCAFDTLMMKLLNHAQSINLAKMQT